jgi:DNA-binding NarL/FixJ family response regulator
MNQKIRVVLINDHRLFTDVVADTLNHEEGIALVGSASDPDALAPTNGLMPCDVVLVNATMENVNAVQATLEIKSELPEVKVIVLGTDPDEETVLRFIEAGASGYISKEASFSELLQTIKAIHRGQTPCSPRITALVFARIAELSRESDQLQDLAQVRLTPREQEVLQLLALGYRNGDIAEQLGIALHTVKSHVHNLLEKLQVGRRREAIQRAYEYGILTGSRSSQPSRMLGSYSLA